MSVHKKLMTARILLQETKLKKTGKNTYAGYDYFELSDFIPYVQKIFADIGLCGVVSYSKEIATLIITDTEDSTQIVITSPMESAMLRGCHPIQNLGAVETYQRRYLWVTAMEILEHDALESSNPKDLESKQSAKKELSPYSNEKLSENKTAWASAIESGKHTADSIINMISTKHTLTDEQKETIRGLGLEATVHE